MKYSKDDGRSMVEMLGVLAIVGVISIGAVVGFNKTLYKYNLNKISEIVANSLRNLIPAVKNDLTNYTTTTSSMAEKAVRIGLISDCTIATSAIAGSSYQVCQTSLGEIYPRFFITKIGEDDYYTYMLYVTFLKNKTHACEDFLLRRWDRAISTKYRRGAKIWLTSNVFEKVVFSKSTSGFSPSDIANSCKAVCGSNASYCSIVFDLSGYAY